MIVTAEQLKEALVAVTLADFRNVPAEEKIEYTFSEEFENWASALLYRMRGGRRYVSTAGRVLRAILIAAIIAALLASTVMAIPVVREAVKKIFIRNDGHMQYIEFQEIETEPVDNWTAESNQDGASKDDEFSFSIKTEAVYSGETTTNQSRPPIPINYRFPTYIPEGLKVESEAVSPIMVSTVWAGHNDSRFIYQQMAQPNGSDISATIALSSDYVHSKRTMCDIEVDFFTSEPSYTIIWLDEYYVYQIVVDSNMPMEEIEKIISSIAPRDDLNNP